MSFFQTNASLTNQFLKPDLKLDVFNSKHCAHFTTLRNRLLRRFCLEILTLSSGMVIPRLLETNLNLTQIFAMIYLGIQMLVLNLSSFYYLQGLRNRFKSMGQSFTNFSKSIGVYEFPRTDRVLNSDADVKTR